MRALYFGTYDRGHPRNVNAISALRAAGVEVEERQVPVLHSGLVGALAVVAAETRLSLPRRRDFDLVIVGYPGHFDVPRARMLAGRKPLVFDAVLSLEDELVGVRRRFRARSTAATLLRVVDHRALRLPDLVVCGTETEASYLAGLGATRTAAVHLGADEEVFCETWAPAYPFAALHLEDTSSDVVRAAAALAPDVPVRIAGPAEIAPDDAGIAFAHAGLLLGSFRDSRAIPASVFGALATGTPVVTADTAATRELVADEVSALLVPPNDPPALATALRRLAGDEELRRRIGAGGAAAFRERASRAVLGSRWRSLLESL